MSTENQTFYQNSLARGFNANETTFQVTIRGFIAYFLLQCILHIDKVFFLEWSIIVVTYYFSSFLFSSNTLKIWLPQLFQAISDYQVHHNSTGSDLCTMLGELTANKFTHTNNSSGCTVVRYSTITS